MRGHHSSGQKKGQFYRKKIFTLCCLRWNINKSKFGKLTRSITASVRYCVNQYRIRVCDVTLEPHVKNIYGSIQQSSI